MNAISYKAQCSILMRKHHRTLLAEAIKRNDKSEIKAQIKILKTI
jgi:hypothetical protein